MFPWKDAPFLDRGSGGSGVTFPATLSKAIAGIKNVDTVIGGHQVPTAWKDVADYQRFNQDISKVIGFLPRNVPLSGCQPDRSCPHDTRIRRSVPGLRAAC